MNGLAKVMLMLTLSLNLNEDSEILMEKQIFGEIQNEHSHLNNVFEGCALVLENSTPMYSTLKLEEEICTLDKGTLVFFEDKGSAFYVHNNDIGGFVKKEAVETTEVYDKAISFGLPQIVKPNCTVNIFSEPNYGGYLVKTLNPSEQLECVREEGDFYCVQIGEEQGYLEKRYARKTFIFTPIVIEEDDPEICISNLYNVNLTKEQARDLVRNSCMNEDGLGTRVALEAIKYVGNKYVWGGNSLQNGVDCSGYVKQLYLQQGVVLPRVSRYQAHKGLQITENDLEPGDLVFYDKNEVIDHVAIYLGQGYIVHASNRKAYPQGGIKVSKMKYREPYKYVRIMEE